MLLQSSALHQAKEDAQDVAKEHDSPLPSHSGYSSSESATFTNTETSPVTSSANGPVHNPQWYNPVNYINLTQQLAAQIIQASHSGPPLPGQMPPPNGEYESIH
ncbi:unnamed protein product [Cylicostephanus goldi]|uniref:Uncharacterized protein n=1 Tax=Cylicostephanus goldi TaxID=71465 RepID=A0A3P6QTQ2_CYLGO|nr:unnamed protein product [Cylicostephanus goldi]